MGYNAKETDSLYKHIPFYIKLNRGTKQAVGYFYHNTAESVSYTHLTRRYHPGYECKWATNTVVHILENREYTGCLVTVSYTHLDVYKRQDTDRILVSMWQTKRNFVPKFMDRGLSYKR